MSQEKSAPDNRASATIKFDDYRIDSPRKIPPEAIVMRFMGGEAYFQNYCKSYNDLVSALEDCVNHGDMEPDEAKQRLERCRKF